MRILWQDQTPRIGGPPISTSITNAEALELGRLAHGRQVLEVGGGYGYSAVVMALAGATHVTSVDSHAWMYASRETMDANLAAYGVADRVTILQRWSFNALPDLLVHHQRFDLVFLDGDHEEEAVTHDTLWSRKLLAPDGILAAHDYGEDTCPGVKASLRRLVGDPDRLVDTLAIYEGLT